MCVYVYVFMCTYVYMYIHLHIYLVLNIYLNIQFLCAFWSLFSPVFLDGMADKISIRFR